MIEKEVWAMAMTDLISRKRFGGLAPNGGAPEHPLVSFHERMNRLFDDLWRDFDAPGLKSNSSLGFPRVEVSETDKQITVEAELPGLEAKDVELLLQDGVLTIRGEKRSESEDKGRRVSERYYGSFERRIALPAEVQEDQISASFKNGVLTVSLVKSVEAAQKVKRISIAAK
jgi:HSP20 family protein